MKNKLIIFFAFLLAIMLLGFVVQEVGGVAVVFAKLKNAYLNHPFYVVFGVLVFFLSLLCGVTRWYILLRKLKLPLKFKDCVRLYAVGHYCNVLGFAGALGGDVVKAAWVAKTHPTKRTELVTSIAAERFIGLFALIIFVVIVCACNSTFFYDHPELLPVRNIFLGVFLVMIFFLLLFVFVDFGKYSDRYIKTKGGLFHKFIGVFFKAWKTFRVCLTNPLTTGCVFFISLANHFVDFFCCYILSRSLDMMSISFGELLVIYPIANTAVALSITPGGAGVREGALYTMLSFVDVQNKENSVALGILISFTLIFWAMVCAIISLIMRPKKST